MAWDDIPFTDIVEKLETSTVTGLDDTTVRMRQKRDGKNLVRADKKRSFWSRAAALIWFHDLFFIAAAVLAAVAAGREKAGWADPILLIAVVLVMLLFRMAESVKTEKLRSENLQNMLPDARVLRNRVVCFVRPSELVSGDILILETGDRIAADARIATAKALGCDESDVFASKKRGAVAYKNPYILRDSFESADGDSSQNMVYCGGYVAEGSGTAIVTATGERTLIASRRGNPREEGDSVLRTGVKKKRIQLLLTGFVMGLVLFLLLSGVAAEEEIFDGALAAAYALTVCGVLAGAINPGSVDKAEELFHKRLISRGIILRDSRAAYDCARAATLVTDVSGVYTEDEITVNELLPRTADESDTPLEATEKKNNLLRMAVLALGSPDGGWHEAVFAAASVRHSPSQVLERFQREHEYEFHDGMCCVTGSGITGAGKDLSFAVFAAGHREVLPLCGDAEGAEEEAIQLEKKGLFVVAVAVKRLARMPVVLVREEIECGLQLLGFIGLEDGISPQATRTAAGLAASGVRSVIVSSQPSLITAAAAVKAGFAQEDAVCFDYDMLDDLSEAELDDEIADTAVFAGLDERSKRRVLDALRKSGAPVVAEFAGEAAQDSAFSDADVLICSGCTDFEARGASVRADRGGAALPVILYSRAFVNGVRRSTALAVCLSISAAVVMLVAACFRWDLMFCWQLVLAAFMVCRVIGGRCLRRHPGGEELERITLEGIRSPFSGRARDVSALMCACIAVFCAAAYVLSGAVSEQDGAALAALSFGYCGIVAALLISGDGGGMRRVFLPDRRTAGRTAVSFVLLTAAVVIPALLKKAAFADFALYTIPAALGFAVLTAVIYSIAQAVRKKRDGGE